MGDGDANKPPESPRLWDPSHDASLQEVVDDFKASVVPAPHFAEDAVGAEALFSGASSATGQRVASRTMGEIARTWNDDALASPTAPSPSDRSGGTRPTAPARRERAGKDAETVEMAGDALHDAIRRATGPGPAIVAPETAGLGADDATPPPGADADFAATFARYVGPAYAQQVAFEGFLSGASWNLDLQAGTVTFEGKGTFQVQLLGSVSESQNAWLWAWANPSEGINPKAVAHVTSLRSEVPLPEFQRSVVPLEDATGDQLALTVSGFAGGVPYFRGTFPGGAVYFLVTGLPFGGRPGLKLVPSLVSSLLSAYPSVDARLVVDGLIEDLELTREVNGDSVIGRSAEGAVEFEFAGESIVRSQFAPRPASPSAPMAALKLKQRVVRVNIGERDAARAAENTDAEAAAIAAAEAAIEEMSRSGPTPATQGASLEDQRGDMDVSGVGDRVAGVTIDTSVNDLPPGRRIQTGAQPQNPVVRQQTDEFGFPEVVQVETSNAQVFANVATLSASGEARRLVESAQTAAMEPLTSTVRSADAFGAMPPEELSGSYQAMAREELVSEEYSGPPGAIGFDTSRGVTLAEDVGPDVRIADPGQSAADFVYSGAAAASTAPSLPSASQSSPRHAPITIDTSEEGTDVSSLIEPGVSGSERAETAGVAASATPTAESAGPTPPVERGANASAGQTAGGLVPITERPAARAAPGKPVARPTIGGGLQLATEIHGAIVPPESLRQSGGLPVFASDPDAERAAEERGSALKPMVPALSSSGESPVQRRPDAALADTMSSSGILNQVGGAARELAAATREPTPSAIASSAASLPADPTPRVWEEKSRLATQKLGPELQTEPTRPASGPRHSPSTSRPIPATPAKAPKSERDLSRMYTVGIGALGVLLVVVLLFSLGGGGADAHFTSVSLNHEDRLNASLSYAFVFDDLPDPPHSIVVHLDSPAFSSPVVVPWNVLTDQPPAEDVTYRGETEIDSVLIQEVTSGDAKVRVSLELNGRTVGSEAVDIRSLYDFD